MSIIHSFKTSLRRMALVLLLLPLLAAFASRSLWGAEILVSQELDTIALDGFCSLREAIIAANNDAPFSDCSAGSGADLILVPNYVIDLDIAGANEDAGLSGDLDVHDDLTIRSLRDDASFELNEYGVGDRIFQMHQGADLTLERVDLYGESELAVVFGGCVASFEPTSVLTFLDVGIHDCSASLRGGGVFTSGPLVLRESSLTGNEANSGAGIAVESTGSLDAVDLRLVSNDTTSGDGGGIYAMGPVSCEACEIGNNDARDGGGIYGVSDVLVSLLRSEVRNNNASGRGGAINAGRLTVERSFFRSNKSDDDGAAVFLRPVGQPLTSAIINSTFTLHEASGNGVIRHDGLGALELFNVTVAHNLVNADQIGAESAGGVVQMAGTVTLRNTVIASNYSLTFVSRNGTRGVPVASDCEGTFWSEGHNLLGVVGPSCTLTGPQLNDQTGSFAMPLDPQLQCRTDFGNFEALPPLATSPVVDAGQVTGCQGPDGSLLATDQGGRDRIWDGPDADDVAVCDIGALELGSVDTSLIFGDGFESGTTQSWGSSRLPGAPARNGFSPVDRSATVHRGTVLPCFG